MKIAIVCDWLVTVGGAEKVLAQIIDCFPEADIFAVVDFLPKNSRNIIQDKLVTTSFIQKLPFAKTRYRGYLPLMPLAIEKFDLTAYDIVISSSHAVAKGVITGPDQLHICYCHSPMRYIWDLQFQYLKEANLKNGIRALLVLYFLHRLRIWDNRTSNSVDYFIANSKYIARRIYKVYRREAVVIYPPVNISTNFKETAKQDFYLTASRLVSYKKIDLIVTSFTKMPQHNLVVIGAGPEMHKIRAIAKDAPNIKILGYQSDQVLFDYLARAKAFIFVAQEDFGILPVEAEGCGTPVIAYKKGGALESVIDFAAYPENATGVFFEEQTCESLMDSIKYFESIAHLIKPINCHKNAQKFATYKFKHQFKDFVLSKYNIFKDSI